MTKIFQILINRCCCRIGQIQPKSGWMFKRYLQYLSDNMTCPDKIKLRNGTTLSIVCVNLTVVVAVVVTKSLHSPRPGITHLDRPTSETRQCVDVLDVEPLNVVSNAERK